MNRELREIKSTIEKELVIKPFDKMASSSVVLEDVELNPIEEISYNHIVGVGFGTKRYKSSSISCVEIETRDFGKGKFVKELLRKRYKIYPDIVKIVTTGEAWAYATLRSGDTIGHFQLRGVGTLGCFVEDSNAKINFLSNNHVIANINKGKRGDEIILYYFDEEIGRFKRKKIAGYLEKFVKLLETEPNEIDAALGIPESYYELKYYSSFRPIGVSLAQIGTRVKKLGAVSSITKGFVYDTERTREIWIGDIPYLFINQIVIKSNSQEPFSLPGDSGSLILNEGNKVLGLLFAGSEHLGYTFANPINNIVKRMEVSLI